MRRGDDFNSVVVRRVANGYIVETVMPHHGGAGVPESVYVFQTLDGLREWLAGNLPVEGA